MSTWHMKVGSRVAHRFYEDTGYGTRSKCGLPLGLERDWPMWLSTDDGRRCARCRDALTQEDQQ